MPDAQILSQNERMMYTVCMHAAGDSKSLRTHGKHVQCVANANANLSAAACRCRRGVHRGTGMHLVAEQRRVLGSDRRRCRVRRPTLRRSGELQVRAVRKGRGKWLGLLTRVTCGGSGGGGGAGHGAVHGRGWRRRLTDGVVSWPLCAGKLF